MQVPSPLFAVLRIAALATGIAMTGVAAHAQVLSDPAHLGMTVPELRQAVPALQRVPRPSRLSGGLVGSWSAPALAVAGVELAPTYFFADGELRRIEYLAGAEAGSDAFGALRDWGRAQWGAELGTQDPEGAYASWSTDDADIYLQQSGPPQRPQVRLVVRRRALKDAGEL